MNLLPVARRELGLAARRDRTYYGRMLTAGAALLVWLFSQPWTRLTGQSGGREIFGVLTGLANWLCLAGGLHLTADAISRERREGTLGLLFLSHLSGWDVVLGKLAAHATLAFYGLLATMPVLALPLLAGGVTAGEFWWAMLVLVNTLFFGASLGLAISTACSEPGTARNAALGALLWFWLGLPSLARALPLLGMSPAMATWLPRLSPLTALGLNPGVGGALNNGAAAALVISHLEGWVFLAAAAAWSARIWRERPAGRARRGWQAGWRNFQLGGPAARAARRSRLLDQGAFYWLFTRQRWKPVWPPVALGLVLMALAAIWGLEGEPGPPLGAALILGYAWHVLLKFWIAGEAAGVLVRHRLEGTFELLLSTPLTVRDIVAGQFRALRRQFGPTVLATALFTAGYPVVWALTDPDWSRAAAEVASPVALLAAAGLMCDAYALAWLASWRALAARRAQHAAGSAVFRVLLLPWLVLLFLAFGGAFRDFVAALVYWVFVGGVSDFLWIVYARDRLLSDFRTAAAGLLKEPAPAGE